MSASRIEDSSGVDRAGLPEGWAWATLDDLAEVVGGVTKDSKRQSDPALPGVPYLRVANVQRMRLDLAEVTTIRVPADAVERYRLQPGDVLMTEGGDRDKLGRGWIWEGQIDTCIHQNHVFRARIIGSSIEPKLLALYLNSVARPWLEANAKQSVNLASISISKIKQLPIPVPPAAEQCRISAALDTRMDRLAAIDRAVAAGRRDLAILREAVLLEAVPEPEKWPPHWIATTTGKAGSIQLGRARHPDWHTGPKVRPYLRVANVFEDRIDTSDVKEMDFSGVFGKYRLDPGDILLNEGQSPHLVGRPAMYRGIPEGVAFTNSLLRFRSSEDVLPGWALLVFRRHLHAGRFMREVRITTNLAHLSAARLKNIEFPVPPLDEQRRLIRTTKQRLASLDRMERSLEDAARYNGALRRALLTEAFSGRLAPQNAEDEPAGELLKRIRVEREVAEAERKEARRLARASRKRKAETAAPPPARSDDTTLADGEQIALSMEFNS
ncbi:restriction endonuclease subunit S [Streptomyces virginiae]|uniref:restriction endonuclease subunit S n=1 Tax=Streptomyces virginiae TaxID=1961 RepID=UPI0030DF4649